MSDYQGFYINLDENEQRRQTIDENLQAIQQTDRYQRVRAVKGANVIDEFSTKLAPGELGCFLSHIKVLKTNLMSPTHLHILEDDAILHEQLPSMFSGFSQVAEWDLIFTDLYFHPPLTPYQFVDCRNRIREFEEQKKACLFSLFGIRFTGTTSYFVNQKSIPKLHGLLESGLKQNLTIDLFINKMVQQGELKAYVTLPFLSTISLHNEDSDVGKQGPNLQALNLHRRSYYIDANLSELHQQAVEQAAQLDSDDHLGIYLESMRSVLNSKYVNNR